MCSLTLYSQATYRVSSHLVFNLPAFPRLVLDVLCATHGCHRCAHQLPLVVSDLQCLVEGYAAFEPNADNNGIDKIRWFAALAATISIKAPKVAAVDYRSRT